MDTTEPKVMLQAHLDVVPAPEALFTLKEQGGRLTGRGTYDMKFAGAIFLKIADTLKESISEYDFGIMFTMDEELGGQDGVKALLDQGYRAKVCILPDGGDDWCMQTAHKGIWILRLTAKGKTAHGSRPWEGDNAIQQLIDALNDISDLFEKQNKDTDTLSINQISGGSAVNQVADHAEAILDIRFLSNEGYQEVEQKINNVVTKYGLESENIACVNICQTDPSHPMVASFLEIGKQVHGQPLGLTRSLGSSDAHFFADLGIPTILARPTGGGPHSNDEWIDKKGFEEYYELVKNYIQKEAKTD
jgi:acetylornithine deacetylase/succinyl-diaminopimelate desuccinylase-like protein